MKNISLFVFLFIIIGFKAQSKKEQIVILTKRVDSLNQVISSQSISISERNKQIEELNSTNISLEKKISSLNNNLSFLSSELQMCKSDISSNQKEIKTLQDELISKIDSLTFFKASIKETYDSTNKRLLNIDKSRTIYINNKPLKLNPFEMFDIMTFKEISPPGLNILLTFTISETGELFYFDDFLNQFTYNGGYNNDYKWTGNEAIVTLGKEVENALVRRLLKNKKYKVIYCYYNDSELWRAPFPTEATDGYYIVDIIEMDDQFEREKQKW